MTLSDHLTGDTFTFSAGPDGSAEDWDAYRQLYCAGGEVIRETADFHAKIAARRLDRVIVFERRLRGLRHERREEHLAGTGFDHYTLQLNLGGAIEVDAGQGFKVLAAGEAILLDARLPMRLRLIDVHLITASLARGLVLCAGEIGHGAVLPPLRTAALRGHLANEARSDADDPRLLMIMLTMLAADEPGKRRLRRRTIQRAVIRDYVEANLIRRDLNPSAIARSCAISRATLYRLTEPDGGVASYIRKVRLARLEHALAEGGRAPLSDLAERLGFADERHMSRQFRAMTGISPGRYRTASRNDAAAGAARRRWWAWMAEFR